MTTNLRILASILRCNCASNMYLHYTPKFGGEDEIVSGAVMCPVVRMKVRNLPRNSLSGPVPVHILYIRDILF